MLFYEVSIHLFYGFLFNFLKKNSLILYITNIDKIHYKCYTILKSTLYIVSIYSFA